MYDRERKTRNRKTAEADIVEADTTKVTSLTSNDSHCKEMLM